jgi:hypothetical protein
MEEISTKSAVEPLSRRDFIKLIAGAGLGFGIALTGLDRMALLNNAPNTKTNNLLREASAIHNAGGTWVNLPDSKTVAIHAAYFYNPSTQNAKIIIAEGSSFDKSVNNHPPDGKPLRAEVYNPGIDPDSTADSEKVITMGNWPQDFDLFCCYQAQLPDGNILFAGGTTQYNASGGSLPCGSGWAGSKKAYRFQYSTESMVTNSNLTMADGRWYPTLVCLANGDVAAFSGIDSHGGGDINQLVEIYRSANGDWINAPQHTSNLEEWDAGCGNIPPYHEDDGYSISPDLDEFPRLFLIPKNQSGDESGMIVSTGTLDNDILRTWNPVTGQWINNISITGTTPILGRFNGTAFLLPLENQVVQKGRILLAGGGYPGSEANDNCQLIEFTSPTAATVSPVLSLEHKRKYQSQIILPDGKCVVFGGTDVNQGGNNVGTPEYIDPGNLGDGWHSFKDTNELRPYHSVALLLADGSVWNAGGTPSSGSVGSKKVQIFRPPYWGQTRPTIDSVTNIGGYGGTLTINTPNAQQILNTHGVSLVKLDAITHHFGANQRLIWLGIRSRTSSSLTVDMPLSGVLAPPGYYMIHVLTGNPPIPSKAKIIKIPGNPDQTTPLLTILSPSAAQIISGPSGGFPITVEGIASDAGSGIQKVDIRIGSSSWVSASPSPSFETLWTAAVNATSQGPTTIQALATDNGGNTSSISIPIRVVFT